MSRKNRKLANRSGKKTCPICKMQRILVEHHINGREIPNPNHPSNIANICDSCHREIHEGLIIIEGWFQTTMGMELFWHSKNENNFTGRESNPYIIP